MVGAIVSASATSGDTRVVESFDEFEEGMVRRNVVEVGGDWGRADDSTPPNLCPPEELKVRIRGNFEIEY